MKPLFNTPTSQGYSNEEYTPLEIYGPLGPFEFDPCAAPDGKTSIGTIYNWTKEDNGLFGIEWPKELFGFVNPPFSDKIEVINKCFEHQNNILLLPMHAYASWHDYLYSKIDYKFEIGERVKFGGAKKAAKFSSVLFPFGDYALWKIKKSGLRGCLLKVER